MCAIGGIAYIYYETSLMMVHCSMLSQLFCIKDRNICRIFTLQYYKRYNLFNQRYLNFNVFYLHIEQIEFLMKHIFKHYLQL